MIPGIFKGCGCGCRYCQTQKIKARFNRASIFHEQDMVF